MKLSKNVVSVLLVFALAFSFALAETETQAKLDPSLYTVENFTIEVKEANGIPTHTIVGVLTLPANITEPVPCVIMLHGTGSNLDEAGGGYAIAAPEMAAKGIATARFNFIGCDAGSEELYKYYSYTNANLDTEAVVGFLQEHGNINDKKLGIMGWSQGGTNALLAARAYPDIFKSVVTWAGSMHIGDAGLFPESSFEEAYNTAKEKGSYVMEFTWREPLPLGKQWFADVESTDLQVAVSEIKAPILAINGLNDTVVLPSEAEEIVTSSSHAATKTHLVEGADHTFNVFSGDLSALYNIIDATISFFNKTL